MCRDLLYVQRLIICAETYYMCRDLATKKPQMVSVIHAVFNMARGLFINWTPFNNSTAV